MFFIISCLKIVVVPTEGVSSTLIKVEISKRYLFANLMWKTFCHTGGVNSIKTNLQTCNLWTGKYLSYKSVNLVWLNLPHQNGKTFYTSNVKNISHLQMNIFCCFDFCHCKRNTFGFFRQNIPQKMWLFQLLLLNVECCSIFESTQKHSSLDEIGMPRRGSHWLPVRPQILRSVKLLSFRLIKVMYIFTKWRSLSYIETDNQNLRLTKMAVFSAI